MAAVRSEPGVCSDCSKWSKKYCKVEAGTTALRDAVKILQKRVEEITQENDTLKEEVKYAKSLADHEKEARVKENDASAALKKEIISLKSELHSLQENMRTERSETAQEVSRRGVCVSDSEKEIKRLKELIKKEKSTAEAALKNAEVEKAKAGEALKAEKSEKSRAEKEKKRAYTESKRAQEYKIQLDALKSEAFEVRAQLTLVTSKCEEANTRFEAERENALAEIIRADLDLTLCKHLASSLCCELEEERKMNDEMNRANDLSSQLDEEKRRNNELQKEVDMLVRSKDLAMGNKPLNDKDASVEELTTHGKTKKKKADRDKKCGNSKADKVVEQRRLIPPDGIKDLGEKKHADKLTLSTATTSSNPSDGINMQLTDSRLYGEVTESMHRVNPAMATNNVVGSHNNADFGGEPVQDKKRKRVLSLLDSVRYEISESKKLHMQIEENVSTLHNVLRSSVDISMYHDNSYDRFDEPYKKRKVFHEQKLSSQRSPNGKCFVEPENAELNGDTVDLGMGSLATVPSNGALACKASNDVLSTENCRHPSECIDHEDEKRYRVARDNLLPPSLPEIDFGTGNAFSVDEVDLTVKDASNERHSWTAQRPLVQEDDKRVDCFKVNECTKHGLPNMAADGSNLEAHGAISPSKTLLNEDLANLYVVHSEIVDREKLSRIFDATRKGVSECHSSSSPGVLLKRVLNYINHGDLLLKDKACVFFSMLLTGCHVAAKNELSDPVRESTVILNSYMAGLNSAIRDIETLNILKQTLSLHELINLMEEFLMNGIIWVCRIRDGILSGAVDSSVPIGDKKLTVEAASTDQLVVTGAILASLCVAFDDIDFIRLLTYNLFRLHKYNYTEVLSVVHVFVQFAGRKFLTSTSNSMLTNVVKSLVLFLERSHSPCSKCPFSEEAVSLDDVLFLLIERLQFLMKKAKTQIHSNDSLEEKLNPEIADTRSGSSLEETFSQFSDVLSLMELIANNVSWDILSCKVVPQLLLMLESSTMDIFSMAIIVFLGQLGRLGVSANGPEDTGVDRLRCQLTAMLGCDKLRKVTLPIQMAVVCSLLRILYLDLNSLHHGVDLNPCVAETSACQIREWLLL